MAPLNCPLYGPQSGPFYEAHFSRNFTCYRRRRQKSEDLFVDKKCLKNSCNHFSFWKASDATKFFVGSFESYWPRFDSVIDLERIWQKIENTT